MHGIMFCVYIEKEQDFYLVYLLPDHTDVQNFHTEVTYWRFIVWTIVRIYVKIRNN